MEVVDYWRLCDELSVIQAALLIADEDTSSIQQYVENWEPQKRPIGYEAAKAAISNALMREAISGTLIPIFEYDLNDIACDQIEGSVDIQASRWDTFIANHFTPKLHVVII